MTPEKILDALTFVPEVQATALQNRITIHVPALCDTVHFVADDVKRIGRIYGPDGCPALEFVIGAARAVGQVSHGVESPAAAA